MLCVLCNAQNPNWQWAKPAGSTVWEIGNAIVVDASGNAYVTGYFQGTSSFDTIVLTSAGIWDMFVAKYDQDGAIIWAKRAGSPNTAVGYGISVDALGNVYVTGYFQSTASFDTIVLNSAGTWDIFITKYDSSGNAVWAKRAGGLAGDIGFAISTDDAGNSYVTGHFQGTADFGTFSMTSPGPLIEDIFIAKYDPLGNVIWVSQAGGPDDDNAFAISIDNSGNSYITGEFDGTATFDTITLTAPGFPNKDMFVAKYDPSGNVDWANNAGGISGDRGSGIGVDNAGKTYVTGIFTNTAFFDTITLNSPGSSDMYIVKYDVQGNVQWAKQAGAAGVWDYGLALDVDAWGNAYITGSFQGTASFDLTTLTSAGLNDIFVAKYDSSGSLSWAVQGGGSGQDEGNGIAINPCDNVYITGYFQNTAVFDTITISSAGSSDIFTAKLGAAPVTLIMNNADASCNSSCDGSATVNVTGGFTPYTYQWNDPNNQTDSTATGLCAGTYTITVIDSAGCAAVDSVTINEPPLNLVTFQKTLGGSNSELIYSVRQTTDGGYIAAGYTMSFGAGAWDAYLVRLDSGGAILWTKTFGQTSNDLFLSVQQTLDGGFIALGFTENFGVGSEDVFLVKTDALGVPTWTKTYGGAAAERGFCVNQTTDGGYIVSGMTASFGVGGYDVYLIKTDFLGDTLWTRTYGGSGGSERGSSVQQTADGGYIVAGWTNSFGTGGNNDIYFIKTDSIGDTLWTKTYGGTAEEFCRTIKQTSDGGYIAVGKTESFGAGSSDIYLIKIDGGGDSVWIKTYGGNFWDAGNDVEQTTDGGYIIAAETQDSLLGNGYSYLINTDSIGDTLWTQNYGGPDGNNCFSVQQTTDGGFIAGGLTFDTATASMDLHLIKTDGNGNSGCNQLSVGKFVGNAPMFVSSGGITGSGAIVNSPSPIVSNTATVDNSLCISICNNLSLSITAFSASCNGSCDGSAIVSVTGGTAPYTYLWNDPGNQTDSTAVGLCAGSYAVTITDSVGFAAVDSVIIDEPPPVQSTFQKTIGGTANDFAWSIAPTDDGNYLVTGETYSFGAGGSDVYLAKIDTGGNILWNKTYGGATFDYGFHAQQTADGGFIIIGTTQSYGSGLDDIYLIKTDLVGDTLWTKAYGGIFNEEGYYAEQTTDGGYILAGYTNSYGAGSTDAYVIKTDNVGDTLWTKTYGGGTFDYATSVLQTTDGGYLITGYTISYGPGNADMYIIKTDSAGNVLWNKAYGGVQDDFTGYGGCAALTNDGGYIITGRTLSFGPGITDLYVLKLDSIGDTVWTKNYGGAGIDVGESIKQTADGGYIITGWTNSFGAGGYDVYLIKLDGNGDTLFTKVFGGTGNDDGFSVMQSADGGYVIAARTPSFGAGGYDIYLIKTDCEGNSGCNQFPAPIGYGSPSTLAGSGVITGSGGIVSITNTITGNPAIIDSMLCPIISCSITSSFTASDSIICESDTVSFTNTSTGATSYQWQIDSVLFDTSTNTMDTFNTAGTYTISLIADSGGCQDTSSIIIIVDSLPSANAGIDVNICYGDSVNLNASGGGAYSWSPGIGLSDSTASNPIASPDTTTLYILTATDSAGNCSATDSIIVTVNVLPPTNINLNICIGDSIFVGGAYQTTTGTYYDTLAAANSCDSVIVTNLIVSSTFTMNVNTNICDGDSMFAGGSYQTTTGIYYDTLTTIDNCDSIIITDLNVVLSLTTNVSIDICNGDSVLAGGAYQYTSGTYYDTLTTSAGCDSVIVTQLTVNVPTVNAGTSVTVDEGSCVTLNASPGVTYSWTPPSGLSCTNCQNPVACPTSTTTYYLTITDSNGCSSIDSLTITVIAEKTIDCDESTIFIPDIFSPNGDGENDVLQVLGKGFSINTFMIYDRWGERVFSAQGAPASGGETSWDGTYKGKMLNPGIFVYYLEARCDDDKEIVVKKGNVTLIK